MSFYNKLKWILGIAMIFILIIATNLIDRNNFIKVRNSVMTIYEDRLVVKGLIFDMTNILHEKELAIVRNDSLFYKNKVGQLNNEMDLLISKFENTKLTKQERKSLDDLKDEHRTLVQKEKGLTHFDEKKLEVLKAGIERLQDNLKSLSNIQLKEGRKQMSISKKAVSTVELFTQIEIYFLVFLAIVIQLIVMYQPKKSE